MRSRAALVGNWFPVANYPIVAVVPKQRDGPNHLVVPNRIWSEQFEWEGCSSFRESFIYLWNNLQHTKTNKCMNEKKKTLEYKLVLARHAATTTTAVSNNTLCKPWGRFPEGVPKIQNPHFSCRDDRPIKAIFVSMVCHAAASTATAAVEILRVRWA